ncbi:MAG: MFS transporter [Candidatus Bathyarchaeota archaeon]|nr:MFS transporter [Candidatus Bathyarchaeota archaeon]
MVPITFSGEPNTMLRGVYRKVGKNAKVLIATEPLWSIPMSWIFFYRPMFLSIVIGLSSTEIGLLITVFNSFASVMPVIGGYLADRFGRKIVLMLFDSTCWLTSLTIWIFSRNIWHVVLAYIIESCVSTIYSVWECLLVEDTDNEFRSIIYGSLSAIWTIGSLMTPIAGHIIRLYGLDSGCRILFLLALSSLIPAFIVRQIYLQEPNPTWRFTRENPFSGIKGYLRSLSMVRRNRAILVALIIIIVAGFYSSSYAYFSLYLIHEGGLGLSESVASLIPFASSTISLILSVTVVPKLRSRNDYLKALILGHGLGALAILLLINSPKGFLLLALLSAALLGFYSTAAFSVSRTFLVNQVDSVDNRAKAKTLSLSVTLSSLVNLLTPTVVGYLFSLSPKIPFTIILIAFSASALLLSTLILTLKR